MKPVRRMFAGRWPVAALSMLLLALFVPAPPAHANYFSDVYKGLQQFSELPSELNKLQESYSQTVNELQQTKENLDRAAGQLGETQEQLGQTQEQLGQAMGQMELYKEQNEALQEQNARLTLMVDELRDDRAAREQYIQRLKIMAYTAVGLVIGYFLLIRAVRWSMRSRSRRGDRRF